MNILNLISAISTEDLKKTFEILWKGVLAIAIVLAIVFILTKLMTFASNRYTDKKRLNEKALQNKQADTPENKEQQ